MTCTYLPECAFFGVRLVGFPAVAKMYQASYCNGKFAECARYVVLRYCGREAVPETLFPNDAPGAEQLLKNRKS